MTWRDVSRILPFLAAGAVIVSIVYGQGYFAYTALDWLETLTLQDLFSLAWMGVPIIFLTFGISSLLPFGISGVYDRSYDILWEKQSLPRWEPWLRFVCALLSVILIDSIPYSKNIYSTIYSIVFIFSVGMIGMTFGMVAFVLASLSGHLSNARPYLLCFMIGVLLYILSAIQGVLAASSFKDHLTLKGTSPACVAVVFAGDRGVFYALPDHSTHFVRWEGVSQIDRTRKSCG